MCDNAYPLADQDARNFLPSGLYMHYAVGITGILAASVRACPRASTRAGWVFPVGARRIVIPVWPTIGRCPWAPSRARRIFPIGTPATGDARRIVIAVRPTIGRCPWAPSRARRIFPIGTPATGDARRIVIAVRPTIGRCPWAPSRARRIFPIGARRVIIAVSRLRRRQRAAQSEDRDR
jgi:hypothetical protein